MANAADVRRLVKKRGTIKAQITSFRTFLAEHREENQIDAIRVRSRVDRLKESFLAFNEICNELDQLDEDHDHTDDRISTEENYLDAISEAENLLIIANSSRAMHNAGNVAVAGLPENTANSPSYRLPRLKLPEASLPKFEGKYEQWFSFKDSFLAMIGDRNELSDVEKMQYLKASLSGDAARKLTMFTITGDNYSRAWELLKNSYQDERLIITRHLSLLIRLPVQERETAAGLTRLADETQQHVMSLQSLGVDVGDHIVVQLIVEKLSKYTRQKWEETLKRNIFPKLNELIEFLYGTASRIAPWESDTREGSSGYATHKSTSGQGLKQNKTVRTFVTTVPAECPACSGEPHPLYRCAKFRENSVQNRIKIVQDAELCVNCLRSHGSRECRFGKCPRCDEHHNALLHQDLGASNSQAQNLLAAPSGMDNLHTSSTSTPKCEAKSNKQQIVNRQISLTSITTMRDLMTSAAVNIYDAQRQRVRCRSLLDTCSTANFITERLASALRLPKRKLSIPVGTLNNLTTTTKHVVTATINSIHDGFEKTLTFLTIPRISDLVPSESIPRENIKIPANIRLADPEFHKPAAIDLLIGSGPSLSMLCIGQINLSTQGTDLLLQKTRLGWVFGGSVCSNKQTPSAACLLSDIQPDLTRFWEMEEVESPTRLSLKELECEKHFLQHTTREESGRYVVALPFKQKHPTLGESRGRAIRRLNSLEKKFNADNRLRQQYSAVIEEYLQLGHMSECKQDNGDGFYLPHHSVVKESSTTTKIRVVFDGSAKASSGFSLNDSLMVGPTIQDDILPGPSLQAAQIRHHR